MGTGGSKSRLRFQYKLGVCLLDNLTISIQTLAIVNINTKIMKQPSECAVYPSTKSEELYKGDT